MFPTRLQIGLSEQSGPKLVVNVIRKNDKSFWLHSLRLSKPTDMTIHWKTVEKNFLMATPIFGKKSIFPIFCKKTSVLKESSKEVWYFDSNKTQTIFFRKG
jgi:hypothetical protein